MLTTTAATAAATTGSHGIKKRSLNLETMQPISQIAKQTAGFLPKCELNRSNQMLLGIRIAADN